MMLQIVIRNSTWLAALARFVVAEEDVISSDAYFYGQSEPVYPTRESRHFKLGLWISFTFLMLTRRFQPI